MGNNHQKLFRIMFLVILDAAIIVFSFWLAFNLRFEFNVEAVYRKYNYTFSLVWIISYILMFFIFGIYKSMWKYASIDEVIKIFVSSACSMILCFALSIVIRELHFAPFRLPYSVALISPVLMIMFSCGMRVAYRGARRYKNILNFSKEKSNMLNVLIVGAGDAGSAIIREIKNVRGTRYNILGVIDDDMRKHNSTMHGVPVLGGTADINKFVTRFEINEIIIAIPSATFEQMTDIISNCPRSGCNIRIASRVYDVSQTGSILRKAKNINLDDLLGREEINLEQSDIGYLENQTIMVTGGGGSIGSEICKQIMSCRPKMLIIFDMYENNAYDLMHSLNIVFNRPDRIKIIIGSVQDTDLVESSMEKYKPDVVFHAAAYKHVPLMEDYPEQAINNNVFGTYNVANCSSRHGVKRFVLISTDKAVNPTNVMGATKRIAELIIQGFDTVSETEFVAVRFGNVLGSSGSVVPLFKKQIEQGGPVTITSPEITRYFMTIPEAASLVIQAGAMAKGGEVFILDMGKSVRILDIALNMIYLSGLVPYQDIDIKFVGLRPGEKLYEELLLAEEGILKSSNKKIYIAQPTCVSLDSVERDLDKLRECLKGNCDIRKLLCEILPTYKPNVVFYED